MDAVRRHEIDVTAYALSTLRERFGDDITIHGPDNVEVAAACSASPSATCTPTTSARSSTSATCASAPATTAPSR